MKTTNLKALFLCLSALWCGGMTLCAESGFQVVANEGVAARGLDKTALKDLFLGKTTYWEGGQAVSIVVVSDKTDSALQEATGMSASQFKTHWQRLAFSGRGKLPKEVDSAEKALALVADTKGAVALLPTDAVPKGVKKIELKP